MEAATETIIVINNDHEALAALIQDLEYSNPPQLITLQRNNNNNSSNNNNTAAVIIIVLLHQGLQQQQEELDQQIQIPIVAQQTILPRT